MKITVFTPTFNRDYCLGRVYESLVRQTKKDFEWLIINDGSTDTTEELVQSWIDSKPFFSIKYVKFDESGGLQRGINKAYSLAAGEYILKIDSDDYLLDDAVESISNWLDTVKDDSMCLGVGGFYLKPDGSMHTEDSKKPLFKTKDYIDCNFFEREKYNLCVDTIEAYKVSIRKNYSIPIWNTEKDGPERVAFCEMANAGYYIRWFNKPIAVVNYQSDGMTLNPETLKKEIQCQMPFVTIIIPHISTIL